MWFRTHAPKPLIDPAKLQFYIENGMNVLMEGRHGVGKTALIKSAFEAAGLNLMIFSGPTMDPWVDFVGVPRPITHSTGETTLELIRRPEFAYDQVDAIFIDEFNRAPAKVRNAAMEILQFQTVNGQKFNRLKLVWAAINPGDDQDYDTDRIDAAQLDRFHVHMIIPNKPCPAYFIGEYGDRGKAGLEWWDSLSAEIQKKVSPRRLEYALQMATAGGSLRDVLPEQSNPKKLMQMLEDGPIFEKLKLLMKKGDIEAARQVMSDPNSGTLALNHVIGSKAASVFFLPLLDKEKLMSLLPTPAVLDVVVRYSANVPEFHNALLALYASGNKDVISRAGLIARKHNVNINLKDQPELCAHSTPIDEELYQEIDPYGRLAV